MNKNHRFSLSLIRILPKISIVVGITSIIWGALDLFAILPHEVWATLFASEKFPEILYVYIFIPSSFISLILGITTFKLKIGKISSVLGIIFSTLALLLWLFIWFWIVGWSVY